VLEAMIAELERRAGDDALVLDVGGWAKPLTRADWVLDILPYETRGLYGYDRAERAGDERFSADTWLTFDMCAREPWPWPDDHFDLAVCGHTLEDLRDPIWACSELSRVARAGYVEVPSRLQEQAWGVAGPWAGWSHHHWLIDLIGDELQFVFKPHVMHSRESDHFPAGFNEALSPEERVISHWWEGSIPARERIFIESDQLDAYLAGYVAGELERRGIERRPAGGRLRRLLGR
jgi:hypothetical protein